MGVGGDARYYDISKAYGYPVDLGKVPSVTTILSVISKPFLYRWYADQGTKKALEVLAMVQAASPVIHDYVMGNLPPNFLRSGSDALDGAGDVGHRVHSYIERILKKEDIPQIDPDAQPAVDRFREFLAQDKLQVIKTEGIVYSATYGFAGTMDGLFGGDRVVVRDWKTSSALRPEYALQGIAYKKAVEEMTGQTVDDIEIIRFDKTGKPFNPKTDYYLVPREAHDYLWKKFLACLDVWRWQNKKDIPYDTGRSVEKRKPAVSR